MEKLSKQLVAFKRNRILVSNPDNKINPVKDINSKRSRLLLSLSDQLKVFGYFLGTDILTTITEQEIEEVYSSVIPWLVEKYHSGEEFKPLYPNFPRQVISLTDAELRFNQELVYRIGVDEFEKLNPWYDKEEIEVQKSTHKYKELKVMTEEEFYKIPTQIMLSNNSLNISSKQELEWFLINYSDKIEIPDRIPFKETLCIVMDNIPNYKARDINDILRYSFYIMGVDPSLPHVSKKTTVNIYSDRKIDNANWRKLDPIRRNKRREICNKIEELLKEKGNIKSSIIDAKRFYGHWLLLSERLHPGDFAKNYPQCYEFFKELKNNKKSYKTWNSVVQNMYDNKKDIIDIATKISERPGELVRRFDSLIRRSIKEGKESEIMDIFIEIDEMKNKTLLELSDYYDRRNKVKTRTIRSKETGKLVELPKIENLDDSVIETIQDIISRKVLSNVRNNVKEKDLVGKTIYLDPNIKYIPIPKDMRNSTFEVPSGIKCEIPKDKNIVRFFVHWIQESEDVQEDLDLHALLVKEDKESAENVGWNCKMGFDYCSHSGDVLNRVGKCAEYIDVDIDKCIKQGYRYVTSDVYNYKGRGLNTLPCWLGYCFRDELLGGDAMWEPSSVEMMTKIETESQGIEAFLVDLKERVVYLINCNLNSTINTNRTSPEHTSIIELFTTEHKITSYEILREYYKARGAEITDVFPEINEEEDRDNYVTIMASDVSKDYIKVLNAIGE